MLLLLAKIHLVKGCPDPKKLPHSRMPALCPSVLIFYVLAMQADQLLMRQAKVFYYFITKSLKLTADRPPALSVAIRPLRSSGIDTFLGQWHPPGLGQGG